MTAPQVRLRLMSANLMGRRGVEARALEALLVREAPDVLALQELGPEQARAIEQTRLYRYGEMDARKDSRGSGLLLRHPAEVWRLPLPRRNGWIAEARVPGQGMTLEVINVHLTPPHYLPPWRMLRQRRTQIAALRTHLAASASRPRVLLGDLNSTVWFPAYRALTELLADAALAVASRNGGHTEPTWGPRPGWPRLLRIDHALIDPSLPVESVRVCELPGSDHAALLVDLLLPAR